MVKKRINPDDGIEAKQSAPSKKLCLKLNKPEKPDRNLVRAIRKEVVKSIEKKYGDYFDFLHHLYEVVDDDEALGAPMPRKQKEEGQISENEEQQNVSSQTIPLILKLFEENPPLYSFGHAPFTNPFSSDPTFCQPPNSQPSQTNPENSAPPKLNEENATPQAPKAKTKIEKYKEWIKLFNLTENNRNILNKKIREYQKMKMGPRCGGPDKEEISLEKWLDFAFSIYRSDKPWKHSISSKTRNFRVKRSITAAHKLLNEQVYGLNEPKEQVLLQIYDQVLSNNKKSGYITVLVGPPGIGKTQLMQSIHKATNIPYQRFSMGGVKDVHILKGHSYTYRNSIPGKVLECRKALKCNNGIICIDELDKISGSKKMDEVSNCLLHLLDPTQNHEWTDDWTGNLHFDLSKVIFFGTANDENEIPPILRDRCNIIHLPGYTPEEKFSIATDFFIPKMEERYSLKPKSVTLTQESLQYLITKYSNTEKGVRSLERCVNEVYKKVNILVRTNSKKGDALPLSFALENFKLPMKIEVEHLQKLLCEDSKAKSSIISNSVQRMYL
jgi:ATP-dependent Lon protease